MDYPTKFAGERRLVLAAHRFQIKSCQHRDDVDSQNMFATKTKYQGVTG
jgi:hypothetical protein